MSFIHWSVAAAAAVLMPLAAAGQTHQQQSGHPDPTAAAAAVPAILYESAFRHYRVASEEEPAPHQAWRSANEEVGRLGGHAGHLQPSVAPRPSAAPHAGHGQPHGGSR